MSRFLTQLDQTQSSFHLRHALTEPNGLLAIGGDLSPRRLLLAAIMAFSLGTGRITQSCGGLQRLAAYYSQNMFISAAVCKNYCATTLLIYGLTAISWRRLNLAPPQDGIVMTWINEDLMASYAQLHDSGYAHSVEVWQNNELVGGLYGISIEGVFFAVNPCFLKLPTHQAALIEFCHHFNRHGGQLIRLPNANRTPRIPRCY